MNILINTEDGMQKAVDHIQNEFAAVSTGKATPALVENINVECYGTVMKLKQLAFISSPEPRLLVVDAFDPKTVSAIEKAIRVSNIGINPVVSGKIIRLPIPPLSEERRRELVKNCKKLVEHTHIQIRGCRREAIDALRNFIKDDDELKTLEKNVQKLTDGFCKKVDYIFAAKEVEVMTV